MELLLLMMLMKMIIMMIYNDCYIDNPVNISSFDQKGKRMIKGVYKTASPPKKKPKKKKKQTKKTKENIFWSLIHRSISNDLMRFIAMPR